MHMTRFVLGLTLIVVCLPLRLSAQQQAEGTQAEFEPPIRLKAGDSFIDTSKYVGHAGPSITDLDADGQPDLLVGNFAGHFQVYKNVGTRTEPVYEDKGLLEVNGEPAKVPNW